MKSELINKLSEELLLNVKMQKDTSSLQLKLEEITIENLKEHLLYDTQKKAFWINIYNAYYQILRTDKKITKPDIYKKKLFIIAGVLLSLDDVEHGVLRRCKFKFSLGFITNFLTSSFIKKQAVSILDYRIHFALNCGAKSCPPIAFYNPDKIEDQLNLATQSFLEGETEFDDTNKIVHTTTLFKWFYADFGKKKGIKEIFAVQLNKNIDNYKLKYKEYSWEDNLSNFVS